MTEGCTVLVPSGSQDAAASSVMLHPAQNRCPTPQGPSQWSLPCLHLDLLPSLPLAGQVAGVPTLRPTQCTDHPEVQPGLMAVRKASSQGSG